MGVPPPATLIDWEGREWTPACGRKAAHPNARFTAPATQCPVLDHDWENTEGVPISAILFGGRRPTTIPLVNEAFDWEHGVFMGACAASETTTAALGKAGVLRHDPFAMLPFSGYHIGDYLEHWLSMAKRTERSKLPRIYYVNWFRRDETGRWLWPGYGDNSRVLKWIFERVEGKGESVETPVGFLPKPEAIDLSGLEFRPESLSQLLAVDVPGWKTDVDEMTAYFATFGDRLPSTMYDQLTRLRQRLKKG
jgi:phosphoenolpyruvate carboxykinase (GTP)